MEEKVIFCAGIPLCLALELPQELIDVVSREVAVGTQLVADPLGVESGPIVENLLAEQPSGGSGHGLLHAIDNDTIAQLDDEVD